MKKKQRNEELTKKVRHYLWYEVEMEMEMMCEKWNNLLGIRVTQCVKDYSIRTACWKKPILKRNPIWIKAEVRA